MNKRARLPTHSNLVMLAHIFTAASEGQWQMGSSAPCSFAGWVCICLATTGL